MAPAEHAIEVQDLRKTYPNGTEAVKGITFQVRRGELFGVLGPNGAGKSTLIGMLGTLVRPTAGAAYVDGINVLGDPMSVRRRIGFAMQDAGVDELATGREFLTLQGRLYGLPKKVAQERAEKLLRLFELQEAAEKKIKAYSGGMKRRIDLAAALIHLPRTLFLDEPSEGLDPRSRMTLWRTLKRLNQQLGATILLSTHYMDEADKLCDRIAIVDQGRIVALDTPSGLKAHVGGQTVVLEYGAMADPARLEAAVVLLRKSGLATDVHLAAPRVNVIVKDAGQSAPRLLQALERANLAPLSLSIQQPTLDDVYLKFTGRKIEQAEATGVA